MIEETRRNYLPLRESPPILPPNDLPASMMMKEEVGEEQGAMNLLTAGEQKELEREVENQAESRTLLDHESLTWSRSKCVISP